MVAPPPQPKFGTMMPSSSDLPTQPPPACLISQMQAQPHLTEPPVNAVWLPAAPPPKHVLSHASSANKVGSAPPPTRADNARFRKLEDECKKLEGERKQLDGERKQLGQDLASAKQEIASAKQQLAQVKGERDRIATQLSAEKEKARSAGETGSRLEQRLHDEQTARKSAEKARDAVQQQLGGFLDSDSKFLERSLALQREQSRNVVVERHAESLAEEKRKREHAETAIAQAVEQLETERNKRRAAETTLREQQEQLKRAMEEQAMRAATQQQQMQQQMQPQVPAQVPAQVPSQVPPTPQAGLNAAACTTVAPAQTSVDTSTQKLWRFIDAQSMMQGPYDSATMRSWMQQGYFQNTTLVRRDDERGPQGPQWRPLANFGADAFN